MVKPGLIASVESSGQPVNGFYNDEIPGGHLNEAGHHAVGRALVDLVQEMGSRLPRECTAK